VTLFAVTFIPVPLTVTERSPVEQATEVATPALSASDGTVAKTQPRVEPLTPGVPAGGSQPFSL
jgi:hypothetical protein